MPAKAPISRASLTQRRAAAWGRAAVVAFLIFAISAATDYYFGNVHEEIFFRSSGRFVDCGSIFESNRLPIAVVNCDGASSGDLAGFVLMTILVIASGSIAVYGSIREYRGSWRRR